jgi:hypothetical protein
MVGIPRSDTASNVDPKGVAQRTEPNYDNNELLKVIRLEGEFVLCSSRRKVAQVSAITGAQPRGLVTLR